ncbi:hypothetical protein BKA62DRAFT_833085 [Auriculariales sp. MPI-PUGE-AT-0066]|nr:hypothetical protein BKA62DRAFT_833085 [Auriculariales sp. MPI-PUGE-AT-0066]
MSSPHPAEPLYNHIRALAEREIPIGTSADKIAAFSSRCLQFIHAAFSDHSERCNSAVRTINNAFPVELVTLVCIVLPVSDRINMCSVSRGWRSLLIAEPMIWSEGDIFTPRDLRWVVEKHQNTPLRLRSTVTMRYDLSLRHPFMHTASGISPYAIYDRYPHRLPPYDFRPQLAPYLHSWTYIAENPNVQQELLEFCPGWPVLKELDIQAQPSRKQPALPHDLAQNLPALRILHLPSCIIPSYISPMRSVTRLSASLEVETPLSVIQMLQKLPSLENLKLRGITSAAIGMFAAHTLSHTLRSVLFHDISPWFGLSGPHSRVDYSPLIQSFPVGRCGLSLDLLSLVAAASIGDAVKVFTSQVSSMPSADAAMSVLAHGAGFDPEPVHDYVTSSGRVQYQLPGIQDRTDKTALSIKVSLTAKPDGLLTQLQSQGHLVQPRTINMKCRCTESVSCTSCLERITEAMLSIQHITGRGIRMSQALEDPKLAFQLWDEVEHIEPSFTSRISHLELSGYSLKGLLNSHISLPGVRSLRLIITCEGDGWMLFEASDTSDSPTRLPSAATSMPNLRTLHAECAQYKFGSATTIASALSKLENMIPPTMQGNRQATMHYLNILITRVKGTTQHLAPKQSGIFAAPTLGQLHAQSQHRASTLERWFIHMLPGLVCEYDRPLDAMTVRLPLWDGFEMAKNEFEAMARSADKLMVLAEPDGVLYEDPQTGFKRSGVTTYWNGFY